VSVTVRRWWSGVLGVVRGCACFPRDARSLSVSRFLVIVGVDDMWGDDREEAGGGSRSNERRENGRDVGREKRDCRGEGREGQWVVRGRRCR
jgi:hypothetical protein